MPALLAARDVSASYGALRALSDVTIEVPEGSVVAVIGPNGAGKSTLLRVLAGLQRPDVGRVEFDGNDVTAVPAHRRARLGIALVPEGRGTFPTLSVEENIRLGAARSRRRAVSDAFPALTSRLRQLAGTLSGGEQQMLSLARLFATDARVVLLDEPSLGLAPRLVDEVFRVVDALRTDGRTIVIVEQYVRRALGVADLVYVMQKGRLVFAGEPGELSDRAVLERAYLGAAG